MKIESILIPASQADTVGLQEVKLSKLGRVVLIAGKNGSGKSRFLTLLQSHVESVLKVGQSELDIEGQILAYGININNSVAYQKQLRQQIANSSDAVQNTNWAREISDQERYINESQNHIESSLRQKNLLQNNVIIGKASVVRYVPVSLNLIDSNSLNPNQLQEFAGYASKPSMGELPRATLAKIQAVQTKWFFATHQSSEAPAPDVAQAVADYERLKLFIKKFIGADLGIDLNGGRATLFGKPLGEINLSQGQKVLIQFCVALYAQDTALSELVLILDEPENHLHPSALNEVLDRLRSVVTNGQIWIATHSVNVLAHFQEETLLYMENGSISFAGNDTMKVLEGLLGDEEERERLARFLALPFIMSGARFAYESLLGAAVVMTGAADPQMQQIKAALAAARAAGTGTGRLKVLDYGAGKGRLVATMQDLAAAEGESLATWLDYVAYDPGEANAQECQNNIARAYGDAHQRHYDDLTPLRQQQNDGSFDLVILTNVFHEIPPEDWADMLSRDIQQLLKPTGKLVIVEDQRLPHGEHAHRYGFLLFDTLEFKKLFAITNQDVEAGKYEVKEEQQGRLKAHYFANELLLKVKNSTRGEALGELVRNAEREITRVRTQSPTSKNGRLHAFWLHQFANAQLAIKKLA